MYSLDCTYYSKDFPTLRELLEDVIQSGMDPNYELTKDGVGLGETAWDHIGPAA